MNRSILIIICDFLVLSAMSLATGTGEARGTKTVPASAIVQVTRNEYLDQMREEVEKRAQVQTEKNTLETDKAQLEAERARLEAEMQRIRQILAQTQNDATVKAAELQRAQAQLQDKDKQLNLATAKQELLASELNLNRGQITALSVDLQKTKDDVKRVNQQLTAREGELKLSTGRMREAELGLAMTTGKLNTTEKELAEAKGKVEKSQRAIFEKEVELAETRTKLENMKNLLNDAVGSLSTTQKELATTKQELTASAKEREEARVELAQVAEKAKAAVDTLEDAKTRLAQAEEQLRSDALTKYAAAAVEVTLNLENERLLLNAKVNEKIYLPEVTIDGKTYLASTFRALTGTTKIHTGYNKVIRLDYQMKRPESTDETVPMTGPVLTLNADNRVALVEVAEAKGEPLPVLTFSQLKERGLQDLTLFKFNSFGKETTSLDGRCSLNLSGNEHYMYIRNSVRNRSELAAEEGDFIISRQGQLVGVVVAVHGYDFGNKEEAQCFIFPDKFNPEDTLALPIVKGEGEKTYSDFVKVLRELQEKASKLSSEYTPQAQ